MQDDGEDDLFIPYLGGACGWCKKGTLWPPDELWQPPDRSWSNDSKPAEPPLAAVYSCMDCYRPSVVILRELDERNDMGERQFRALQIRPSQSPSALGVELFEGTTLEHFRNEAWATYWDGHYRSAIVTARSALQACCRRYLDKSDWSHFNPEAEKMSALAGTGWDKIGGEVREFGNRWAHPDPADAPVPTWQIAREALDRMDAVLQFIGALERFGHLEVKNPN